MLDLGRVSLVVALGAVLACDGAPAANGDAAIDAAHFIDAHPVADAGPAADAEPDVCVANASSSSTIATVTGQPPVALTYGFGGHIGSDCEALQVLFSASSEVRRNVNFYLPPYLMVHLEPLTFGTVDYVGLHEIPNASVDLGSGAVNVSGTLTVSTYEHEGLEPRRLAGSLSLSGSGVSVAGEFDVEFCAVLNQYCI